ncbi:hypothetical protein CBR_g8241 [Chara braunii]|uniref:RING-type E3 ubiquitin transferase n=1 Tax=Chara braunii TaxID=69332 RepID=A0A388KLL7_CHABU|nr:hypothetical protein CBR_g8241 [Chara braunii]|eukprot:GBG70940.1 hypothetical protein CBR_g8241 [Chara braunii]
MAVAGGSMENTATAALVFLLGHIPRVAGGAKDVVIQKANFAVLSGHLQNMHAVFEEIAGHTIDDDSETREALQKLQAEIIMAQKLVDECVRKSKFFLLLKCRQYAKRLEITTREIGRCLSLLLDSGIEMFPAEREQIRAIENQMQTVEFHAGELEASICDKLEKALTERRDDIELVNSLLEEIAQVCGIPAESSSLTTELASFRMEKEEVLKKKDMADGAYLEQVIAFLSRGDAANSAGQVQREYLLKRSSICDGMISVLPPLQAFLCPITGEIMQDPVSLETGQTYERSAIEEWFGCGNLTCPVTGAAVMKDGNVSLQPNRALKDSIHEWRDHNYVITIRSARVLLESKNVEQQAKALRGLHQACMERASNRCWVNAEGVLPACSDVLKSENKGLRIVALQALLTIVKDHDKNKVGSMCT